MGRHIRGWYGLSDCHGSQTEWTQELPDDWDSLAPDAREKYLEDLALEALYNFLDCGAEVVDDVSPASDSVPARQSEDSRRAP